MNRFLAAVVVGAAAMTGFAESANATLQATTSNFYKTPTRGYLTFTFDGFSAGDTDKLKLDISGQYFFVNKTTKRGVQFTTAVLDAGIYTLSLWDLTVKNTWSSDPSKNSDHRAHLVYSTNFADFHIGKAPGPAGTVYYGWEDRKFPKADGDYNDLTFSIDFTAVPEPISMAVLGTGLAGLGLIRRRRG